MAAVERTLTINLRKEIMKVPDYKRAKKAVTALREFLQRHMKAEAKNVKIGKYLNLKIWEHGIKKPAHKITVVAKKDDKGIVTAELPNIPTKKQSQAKAKKAAAAAKTKKTTEKTAAVTTATSAATAPTATTAMTATPAQTAQSTAAAVNTV